MREQQLDGAADEASQEEVHRDVRGTWQDEEPRHRPEARLALACLALLPALHSARFVGRNQQWNTYAAEWESEFSPDGRSVFWKYILGIRMFSIRAAVWGCWWRGECEPPWHGRGRA